MSKKKQKTIGGLTASPNPPTQRTALNAGNYFNITKPRSNSKLLTTPALDHVVILAGFDHKTRQSEEPVIYAPGEFS